MIKKYVNADKDVTLSAVQWNGNNYQDISDLAGNRCMLGKHNDLWFYLTDDDVIQCPIGTFITMHESDGNMAAIEPKTFLDVYTEVQDE